MRRFDALWKYASPAFTDVTSTLGSGSSALTLAAGERLYLGFRDWLSGFWFNVSTPSSTSVVIEIFDGDTDTWKELALQEKYTQLVLSHSRSGALSFLTDGAAYWAETQYRWIKRVAVTGSFPETTGTVPSDSELFWVRLRNTGADDLVLDRVLPLPYNTYVTHEDLAQFLAQQEFDEISDPMLSWVRVQLRRSEDWLDNYARRTWRIKPYYNEHYDFNPYGFVVKHRPLITVSGLRFWQGSSFVSMIEGRGHDWFVTPEKSIIRFTLPSFQLRYYSFLLSRYLRQPDSVEVDYIAGVDFDLDERRGVVQDIVLRRTAIALVQQADYSAKFIRNPDNVPKLSKIEQWLKEYTTWADELRAPVVV